MPLSTKCHLAKSEVSIEQALAIRDGGYSELREMLTRLVCAECGQPVRPHKDGPNMAAHFEHLARNPSCSLSDPPRG